MGKEGLDRKEYLRDEPEQFAKPNKRMKAPVIFQPGFAVHPSTVRGLGEALKEKDENVWLNAHLKKESRKFLEAELKKAKKDAREIYYRDRISSGEITEEQLDDLLNRIPLTLFAEARGLIQLIENPSVTVRNEPLTVIGYSQGAPATLVAVLLRPDLFPKSDDAQSTLILLNPGGLTGKREKASDSVVASEKTLAKYLKRVARGGWLQARYFSALIVSAVSKGHMGSAALDSIRYLSSHTISGETDQEARDMANTDMVPFINFLTEVNGLRIAVLYDENDGTFPARVIEKRKAEFSSDVEFYKTKNKGHFGPVHDGKGIADEIDSILKNESPKVKAEKSS